MPVPASALCRFSCASTAWGWFFRAISRASSRDREGAAWSGAANRRKVAKTDQGCFIKNAYLYLYSEVDVTVCSHERQKNQRNKRQKLSQSFSASPRRSKVAPPIVQ